MIKHKLLTLLVALCATTALWAGNVINYTATEKLEETTDAGSAGLHTNAFNVKITSHKFSNGVGTVTFAGKVTTIGYRAFYECSALTSVTIPNSVTTIEGYAFYGCSGLTSITIPNSVTTIGEGAFYYCSGLTSITIPNSVTTIGDYAFRDCKGLTSVTIPNSVTTIGEGAFYGCSGLTSITIPNSVATIGSHAFADCSGLTSITIPNSVTTIGNRAFYYCSGLTSIDVDAANTHYASVDGVLFNYAKDTLIQYPASNPRTEYTIPNSVTTIGEGAFGWCDSLTSIIIPNSVTTIGEWAFANCSGLTSIIIPNSVTTIGRYAFYGCKGLTSIIIPNSVTTIGESAFEGCSGLTSVTIPNSVTEIGYWAFCRCSGLTSISIPNSVTWIGSEAFEGCKGLKTVYNNSNLNITKGSTDNGYVAYYADNVYNGALIGDFVIKQDTLLTKYLGKGGEVTIPNSVTTIGNYAFDGCSGLTSIIIPNSVTTIGSWAFEGCKGLTSVTIPNSVTTIGKEAFRGCTSLTSVTIPNSVTTIGSYAFYNCTGLTSIGVDATNTHYASIDGVLFNYTKDTLIQYPASNPRTEYTIPNSVTTIGRYAFLYCSGLTSITIPNSVTTIGNYAFYGCSGLTSIIIPNSVTTIGAWAFYDCNSLTSITCEATTPPTCGDNCFLGVDKSIPLYVPAGSVDAYKAAGKWKNFTDIRPITAQEVEVTEIEADPTESAVEIAWPSVVNAETYTIEIRLGDQLICSIVFNAQGQLVSINFNLAPGRGGHTYATTAESTATGWAYTIAGLTPGITYNYSVIAKNADGQVIDTKSGVFSTQGLPTSIDNMGNNFNNSYVNPTKSLRNGQVIIRQGDKTYNVVGQEVK